MSRIDEARMATVVRAILRGRPNHAASYAELRTAVRNRVRLSPQDRVRSVTRPAEELWMQIIRNLWAHKRKGFVRIPGGLRLRRVAKRKAHLKPTVNRGARSPLQFLG